MSKKQFSKRRRPFKEQLPVIYIYCEGENTEPDYFNQFRVKTVRIKSLGIGDNTLRLVEAAIASINNEKFDTGLDQKWCVFDKDDFSADNFNSAIIKAEKNGFGVAWSNQSFEYWFLLHFEDHQGGFLNRNEYTDKINNYIVNPRSKYNIDGRKKVAGGFADELNGKDNSTGLPRVVNAIKRAGKIHESKNGLTPAQSESCTTVYNLVEQLRKYME